MSKPRETFDFSPEKQALLERLLVEEGLETYADHIPQREQRDIAPLSFAQERLWFVHQLEPGSPVYNMPAALRIKGRLNTSALEKSLNEIVRRHDGLRTVFREEEDQVLQVVRPAWKWNLEPEDLGEMPEAEREEEVRRRALEEAQRPFDLSEGPLIRLRLLRVEEETHVLLVTIHHMVFDGWSMGVFFRELTTLYEANVRGEKAALPELPIQYGDYAEWQRERLSGEAAGRVFDLLEKAVKRRPGAPGTADGPPASADPDVSRSGEDVRRACGAAGEAGGVGTPGRGDAVHDAAGGVQGVVDALFGTDGDHGGHPGGESRPEGNGAADRPDVEHAGALYGWFGRADVRGNAEACETGDVGGVCASGSAV